MKRTAFVADRIIGISPNETKARGIHLVSVQVIVDGATYRDQYEFRPEALRRAQPEGRRISTSQVNSTDLKMLYWSPLERCHRVISVHMASKLSGPYATAKLIATPFEDRVKPNNSHLLRLRAREGPPSIAMGIPNHLLETI